MHGGSPWRDGLGRAHEGVHRIGDAAAAHHVDAGDLDDLAALGVGAGGLDVDDAKQAARSNEAVQG